MPMVCGGVFYIANFAHVRRGGGAGAADGHRQLRATAESAVVMTGFDTIRINDAIARWVDHPVEKPSSISVHERLPQAVVRPTGGMTLKYVKAAFCR
jgi:hypothetical protein